ncbi:MAG: bifunctional glycosyltransferase family 2/GtrA family protein [Oscillospiraceae bacterium]|nr:bifunctional glycosyltransferase family 2/GtrA family protein [Oscillospiraceae bacterium]
MSEGNAALPIAAVIPSLQPTAKLLSVVKGLCALGFEQIVVVNDGSGADCEPIFDDVHTLPRRTVLAHPGNRGKGAALHTAFAWLLQNRPDIAGAVTADGDGQHLPEDVLRCAAVTADGYEGLVLGVRDFSLPDVPPKSRFGNRITRAVFRFGCGIRISDTQTGLRAVPLDVLPLLLQIKGDRYEYETNMLLETKRCGLPIREVPIQTVYEDSNADTHFHPFRDSLRIYRLIIGFMLSSAASTLVDLLVFYLINKLFGPALGAWSVLVSTAAARAVSSFFNFNINKRGVFASKDSYRRTLARYYALCIPQMLVSAACVTALSVLLAKTMPLLLTVLKMAVDTALFFASFVIQREWVFKGRK